MGNACMYLRACDCLYSVYCAFTCVRKFTCLCGVCAYICEPARMYAGARVFAA